jgi:hypothetical protein
VKNVTNLPAGPVWGYFQSFSPRRLASRSLRAERLPIISHNFDELVTPEGVGHGGKEKVVRG